MNKHYLGLLLLYFVAPSFADDATENYCISVPSTAKYNTRGLKATISDPSGPIATYTTYFDKVCYVNYINSAAAKKNSKKDLSAYYISIQGQIQGYLKDPVGPIYTQPFVCQHVEYSNNRPQKIQVIINFNENNLSGYATCQIVPPN